MNAPVRSSYGADVIDHMAQLRTLRGAAKEMGCHHQVLTRRIRDGSLFGWRVDGVVLVRLDQARMASAQVPDEASSSAADVRARYRALADVDETAVELAGAWLVGHLRPIKTFTASTCSSVLAELMSADIDYDVTADDVTAAAIVYGFGVRTFHGRLPPDPLIAVSAADVHAVQLHRRYTAAKAPLTSQTFFG